MPYKLYLTHLNSGVNIQKKDGILVKKGCVFQGVVNKELTVLSDCISGY